MVTAQFPGLLGLGLFAAACFAAPIALTGTESHSNNTPITEPSQEAPTTLLLTNVTRRIRNNGNQEDNRVWIMFNDDLRMDQVLVSINALEALTVEDFAGRFYVTLHLRGQQAFSFNDLTNVETLSKVFTDAHKMFDMATAMHQPYKQ